MQSKSEANSKKPSSSASPLWRCETHMFGPLSVAMKNWNRVRENSANELSSQVLLSSRSMKGSASGEGVLVDHEVGRVTRMRRTHSHIFYTQESEGRRHHLRVEREVFRTHHGLNHLVTHMPQHFQCNILHELTQILVVHGGRVEPWIPLKEIYSSCASVHTSLFHNYLCSYQT